MNFNTPSSIPIKRRLATLGLAITTSLALSAAAHAQTVLFTTLEDFTGWGTNPPVLTTTPTTTPDLDGITTNGLGNTSNAGGAGTGGSLTVTTGTTGGMFEGFGSPYEGNNAAFANTLATTPQIQIWYTPPSTPTTGSYFELLLLSTYMESGGNFGSWFTSTSATSVVDSGSGYFIATYDFSAQAAAIQTINTGGLGYWSLSLGAVANTDFTESTFTIDHIVAVPEPSTAGMIMIGGIGVSLLFRRRNAALSL